LEGLTMTNLLLAVAACVIVTPAHAMSIVSLHAGMAAPVASAPVDMAIIMASISALAATIGFRLVKR
jgi:hypothetical protein